MSIIAKAKAVVNALKNIDVMLANQQQMLVKLHEVDFKLNDAESMLHQIYGKQYEAAVRQNEIYVRTGYSADSVLVERHKEQFGVYKSSDSSILKSSICRMQDIIDFDMFAKQIGPISNPWAPKKCSVMHRKAWEFIFIAQALYERGMLNSGKRGLGFAVGKEPLSSLFAKHGCEIVATDLSSSAETAQIWTQGNQHSDSLNDLYNPNICDRERFENNVSFRFVDMNDIPDDCSNFDFCWSACAFEHLGSIHKGKQFIYNMMKCLKPGGIAVHTTEYNMSSTLSALDDGGAVLFGQNDFVEIRDKLIAQGHHVEELDFRLGDYEEENLVAYPPYNEFFFKLCVGGFITTSFGLIIKKAE